MTATARDAPRIFVLSPASCRGRRAALLMREAAAFPLALQLRQRGAPLGEVFSFLSGLYFRGKLAYATAFARPPRGLAGTHVITPSRGLVRADVTVGLDDLHEFAAVDIRTDNEAYRVPLERSARTLARGVTPDTAVVLLGSIATAKYADCLNEVFGARLLFPEEFAGRGDMSRGGLMLRCVDERRELRYVPVNGAPRRGPRPPKLAPRPVSGSRR